MKTKRVAQEDQTEQEIRALLQLQNRQRLTNWFEALGALVLSSDEPVRVEEVRKLWKLARALLEDFPKGPHE